jgi:signal transduction histidine kinase
MTSKSLRATLARAQEEIQDLLLDLQSGTLDQITLEAGLKQVQERLKALGVHQHKADIESDDDDPDSGNGHKPR